MKRLLKLSPLCLLLVLAACGTVSPQRDTDTTSTTVSKSKTVRMVPTKQGGGYYKDDGPGAEVPDNLDEIPDAQPRNEPLHRWANRPYTVLGKDYVPLTRVQSFHQEGIGSWYGRKFHGQKTSIGETYDMFAMSAAHPTLPLPSYVRVTNPDNGRSVILRVNDRGPFHSDRIIDLSYTAAYKLGYINQGSNRVIVDSIVPGQDDLPVYAAAPAPVARASDEMDEFSRKLLDEERQGETQPTRGIFLQLGAFANADNAENLRNHLTRDLDWLTDPIRIQRAGNIHRLQLGPFTSRAEAERMAQRIRVALGYAPTIVSR